MDIRENDKVKLKDGRKGVVVMVYVENSSFQIDFGEYEEMVDIEQIKKEVWL
ncbi:MAG: hypothetical protein K0R72_176 [Clostridia bacterium]|jgi:hypothetical protein|nr:hypothetical protein [Clostridia bacterium]